MKFFQSVQKYFAFFDISSSQSQKKYPWLSGKILAASFCYWTGVISFFAYILREANGFQEYIELIFRILFPILVVICFTITIFNMNKLFKLIDSYENVANKSKAVKFVADIRKSE